MLHANVKQRQRIHGLGNHTSTLCVAAPSFIDLCPNVGLALVTSLRSLPASYYFQDFVACKVFTSGDGPRLFPGSAVYCYSNASDRQTLLLHMSAARFVLGLCCDLEALGYNSQGGSLKCL